MVYDDLTLISPLKEQTLTLYGIKNEKIMFLGLLYTWGGHGWGNRWPTLLGHFSLPLAGIRHGWDNQ